MNNYFIKLKQNPQLIMLFRRRPTAFLLLTLIAIRAKNSKSGDPDLKVGEALIGDWSFYCKSERCYRSDKLFLKKHQISTFKPTPRGTIAKLNSTEFFDVEWKKVTNKVTDKRRTSDEKVTTNREIYIRNKRENKSPSQSGLHPCSDLEILKIASDLNIAPAAVRSKHETILDKIEAGEFKNKTVYFTLRDWLRRDLRERRIGEMDEVQRLAFLGMYGGQLK